MKTLTVTEARKNLSSWLRRAKSGEEIGIVDGADIIALRPVKITSVDYFLTEYDLTAAEAESAALRIAAEAADERAQGKLIPLDRISVHAQSRTYPTRGRRSKKPRA